MNQLSTGPCSSPEAYVFTVVVAYIVVIALSGLAIYLEGRGK